MIEVVAKGAEKTGELTVDDGDRRPQIFSHRCGLLQRENRRKKTILSFSFGKIGDVISRIEPDDRWIVGRNGAPNFDLQFASYRPGKFTSLDARPPVMPLNISAKNPPSAPAGIAAANAKAMNHSGS